MQLTIRILLLIFVIAALLLYGTLFLFLNIEGKDLLTKQLEFFLKREVKVEKFNVSFPLRVTVEELDIKDLFKVKHLEVTPSLLWLAAGHFVLRDVRVVSPELTLIRGKADTVQGSVVAAPVTQNNLLAISRAGHMPVAFRHLSIDNGKINFTDYSVGKDGIRITIDDIRARFVNIYRFPMSFVTNFEINGKIPWKQGQEEGTIEAEGWADLFKKDIEATLKIRDIDGIYLYPYYYAYVDLDKARIEKAKLNFSSEVHGLNNNITAECHLELADIVRKPPEPGSSDEKAAKITDAVLGMFKAMDDGKVVLDFTVRTKMDTPTVGIDNIKEAVENKLKARPKGGLSAENVISFPGKLLVGVVNSATDLSKAVISGTFAVGKELKDSLKASFTRER